MPCVVFRDGVCAYDLVTAQLSMLEMGGTQATCNRWEWAAAEDSIAVQ